MKTQKNDKKCNLTTFDAKATQSHTEFMYSNICIYPPVMGFCAAGKKVGKANAKEWDVKVCFPIH